MISILQKNVTSSCLSHDSMQPRQLYMFIYYVILLLLTFWLLMSFLLWIPLF